MKEFYDDAFFEQFSTERLEEMIDLGMELPASENRKALLRILEVLEERENDVDVEKAWEEFQMYYNIPEGSGIALYETGEFPGEKEAESAKTKKKSRVVSFPRLRAVGRVAVVAAVTFVLMITTAVAAQAAGYDVFGALGRWTDETFHFELLGNTSEQPTPEQYASKNEFQEMLATIGVTQDLAPTWYPDGFESLGVEKEEVEDEFDTVWCNYYNKEKDIVFSACVTNYYNPALIETLTFEKDDVRLEKYEHDGKDFYIMTNLDTVTATWSNGKLVETISGQITWDELENIIDSIGG